MRAWWEFLAVASLVPISLKIQQGMLFQSIASVTDIYNTSLFVTEKMGLHIVYHDRETCILDIYN